MYKKGLRKTKEEFIEECIKLYGNKYNYSLVNYINGLTKVKIICSEHGEFEQTPKSFLNGYCCKKCNKLKKMSLDSQKFINDCDKKHKNKYDYSLVDYKGYDNKIKIICKEHGVFEQQAGNHKEGRGCRKCADKKIGEHNSYDLQKFLSKCAEIHKDRYDYSLTYYKNSSTKVKIICKEHGIFEQLPTNHLKGCNCPKCSRISTKNQQSSNTEEFIKKSKGNHVVQYDYSLVNYKNSSTRVKIICPKHGIFEQFPYSHIKGADCKLCARENNKGYPENLIHNNLGLEEFKKRSSNIHNNKYDYSLVEYINCKTKVEIICPKHGIFKQIPDHHYRGVGCPECSNFYGSFQDKTLYIFYDEKYNLMKIGVSKDPDRRLSDISKGKDKTGLKILEIYEKCASLETFLHKKYEPFRTTHTLYEDGSSEWFKLNESEITNINDFVTHHKQSS